VGASFAAFGRPSWDGDFPVDVGREIKALRDHAATRKVPKRTRDGLLVATWNMANMGVQKRDDPDYAVLAEVVSWFDLVAVQEVNDNLEGLRALQVQLPSSYRVLFSDASGNQERGAFIYDGKKIDLLEKVGRLSIPPSQLKQIKLPDSQQPFPGFDRGPYLAAFAMRRGGFRFLLVNVHLFYGTDDDPADIERRALEAYAVAWWANKRRTSNNAFVRDIMPLGDFNLPVMEPSDPIFRALTSRGLQLPEEYRISQVGGSSLQGLRHYDQVAFFPAETTEIKQVAVFDFDNAIYRDVWEQKTPKQFLAYTRFHASDHRPLWAEFRL